MVIFRRYLNSALVDLILPRCFSRVREFCIGRFAGVKVEKCGQDGKLYNLLKMIFPGRKTLSP